jgi:formylglycine-generating enzyme
MSWLGRILVGASVVVVSVVGAVWLTSKQHSVILNPSASSQVDTEPVLGVRLDAGVADAQAPAESAYGAHPLSDALCPPGMNWVGGDYCPSVAVSGERCKVEPRALDFCIDVHEYPNQAGVRPSVMVSFNEAAQYCESEGKRLCGEGEWTFACRGVRRISACNFGQTSKRVRATAFWDPSAVARELEAVDGRRPSGSSECQSTWGLFDALGNVQEWVSSEHAVAYDGAMKGGCYNESSIGCERSIQTRKPDVRYPQTGFRCCADPLVRIPGGP